MQAHSSALWIWWIGPLALFIFKIIVFFLNIYSEFAEIARPLHCFTEIGRKFKWDDKCQRLFVYSSKQFL